MNEYFKIKPSKERLVRRVGRVPLHDLRSQVQESR